jgi:hypothetical protein
MKPLDVMLEAMRNYCRLGQWDKATDVAAKLAPHFHQRLVPTDQPAVPHKEQEFLPLFDSSRTPALGKKDRARLDAELAGRGTDWGDDLNVSDKPN